MIGMIEKGKGDLIAADLTTTAARQDVLEFSRSFMSSPLTVLTKVRGARLETCRRIKCTSSDGMLNPIVAAEIHFIRNEVAIKVFM